MSVTSMNSRMAMAEKLSIPQLQQAIKAGSVPAYVGIPLLQEKMKLQRAMQAQMGQEPQPEGTIADQIMQEADAEGITRLPSNLPLYDTDEMYSEMGEEREYARGGIVALAEGGTGEEGPQPKSLPATTYLYDARPFKEDPAYRAFVQDGGANGDLRYSTFLELGNPQVSSQFEPPKGPSESEIELEKQTAKDKETAGRWGEEAVAAAKDIGSIGVRALGTGADYLSRVANALGANAQRTPDEYTFTRGSSSLTPYTDKLRAEREEAAQQAEAERPAFTQEDIDRIRYSDTAKDMMGDVQVPTKAGSTEPSKYTGESSAGYGTDKTAPAGGKSGAQGPAATGRGQAPSGGISNLPAGKGGASAPATLKAAEKAADSDSPQSAPASQALSMLDKYVAMLEKSGESVDRDKKEALYMALIQGGLAAAGGTSPNALANIAAGMVPAMQGYQQALAGIKKDERARLEKLMAAGLKKEEFLLQAKKIGIEEKKADNWYEVMSEKNRVTASRGAGGDGRNERAINAAYNSATGAFNRATTDIDKQIQLEMNKPAYMYGDKSPGLAAQKKEIQTRIDALNQRKSRVEQQYYSYVRNNLGIDIPDFSGGAGTVPTISSQAEYAKLPSGAQYRDPNGVLRTKG